MFFFFIVYIFGLFVWRLIFFRAPVWVTVWPSFWFAVFKFATDCLNLPVTLWCNAQEEGGSRSETTNTPGIHHPGGIRAISAGSRSETTNTPGIGVPQEVSTPARGASSGRSAINLSRWLRSLRDRSIRGAVIRWCRRYAPQPPANCCGSLRDVYKAQGFNPGNTR